MKALFVALLVSVTLPANLWGVDTLRLKDGKVIQGKIEMITHKVVSIRLSVDLGRGKRGEAKRSILLKGVEFIEFGPAENEERLLKQGSHASRTSLKKLWDQKVGYLAQARSNAGEVGLLFAEVLLATDSSYHWNEAMDLYDLVESRSWNKEDHRKARIGRIRGLVVQENLDEATKLARREIERGEDEAEGIEARLLLGDIGFCRLKSLQKRHPKWEEDDAVRPKRNRIYHETLDHFMDAHLFHSTWNESAARGLMGAVEVYRLAGKHGRARECLEDVVQIYPITSLADRAARELKKVEQVRIYNDDKQTSKQEVSMP